MRLLALDLAGRTGWAMWREGMPAPIFGVCKLPKSSPGAGFAAFRDWLAGKLIGDGIEHVVVESIFVREETLVAAPRLYGLMAIVEELAYRRGLSINPDVTVTQWRAHFIGQGHAPKTVEKKHRRQWLKDQAKKECEQRGWPVRYDDESDALGLLVFERARLLPQYGQCGELFGYEAAE